MHLMAVSNMMELFNIIHITTETINVCLPLVRHNTLISLKTSANPSSYSYVTLTHSNCEMRQYRTLEAMYETLISIYNKGDEQKRPPNL